MICESRQDGMQLHRFGRDAHGQTGTICPGMTKGVDGVERQRQVMHRCISRPHTGRKEPQVHFGFFSRFHIYRGSESRMVRERERCDEQALYIPQPISVRTHGERHSIP